MVAFITTFSPGPIRECLLEHLPVTALRNLQLTCHEYANLYAYALPTKWGIDRHLSRWLPDSKAFRRQLDLSGAIVSGSGALQYFDQPTAWQPDDLDVYLLANCTSELHWHLVNAQDYVYSGTKTAEEAKYPVHDITEVRTYSRLASRTGGLERIQLICLESPTKIRTRTSHDQCVKSLLQGFHSTVVLNFLTGTQGVSLFPQTTFGKRKTYLQNPYSNITKRAVQKYVDRGWAIADVLPRERKKLLHPLRKARFVGDKLCWRIEYKLEGVSRIPLHNINPVIDAPLWWATDEQEHKLFREIEDLPYLIHSSSEKYDRRVSVTRTHYYLVSCYSFLSPRDLNLYRILARLSAAHTAHQRHNVEASWRPRYCNCERPLSGLSGLWWASKCELDASNKPQGPWNIESVGSCAGHERMVRMAEEQSVPDEGFHSRKTVARIDVEMGGMLP